MDLVGVGIVTGNVCGGVELEEWTMRRCVGIERRQYVHKMCE